MRPANWPILLAAYLDSHSATRFAWGVNDCVSFASEWFRLMTGRDVYRPWRGRYMSHFTAQRRIREAGARDMADAGRILFGDPSSLRGDGRRGDIALARGAFGIVMGAGAAFLHLKRGLVQIKPSEFEMVWAV